MQRVQSDASTRVASVDVSLLTCKGKGRGVYTDPRMPMKAFRTEKIDTLQVNGLALPPFFDCDDRATEPSV
jgi:hypothetical protein